MWNVLGSNGKTWTALFLLFTQVLCLLWFVFHCKCMNSRKTKDRDVDERESWKYLNFNLEKNIDRPIKRMNNAKVKGYFWSSLSLRFVIVKKCQACCLICQTLQDGCLEFLLSSCFVLVAAFSLLTYAFCSLVAEFHFLRVQGKQNIIVILEVPQI